MNSKLTMAIIILTAFLTLGHRAFAQEDAPTENQEETAPAAPAILDEGSGEEDQPAESDINFYVDLEQNRTLEGLAVDIQSFKITTGFGEVDVPLEKVDAIRLNATEDGTAVIAFKNGDILTGVLHLDTLKLRTGWGFATANLAYIKQISATRGARFDSVDAGGKRKWNFTPGSSR